MNTITIIYDQSHYLYRWMKPLLAARRESSRWGTKSSIHRLPIICLCLMAIKEILF